MEKKKYLWVFGNAVQDVTVEVDLDRLAREHAGLRGLVRVQEGLHIRKGVWLTTTFGLQTFAVEMDFAKRTAKSGRLFFHLTPGTKHLLTTSVQTDPDAAVGTLLAVPCDNLAWGGGGVNVVTYARALAPSQKAMPLRYTDVAMSRTLPGVITAFERLKAEVDKHGNLFRETMSTARVLEELYDVKPLDAETLTCSLAETAARYSPQRSLEVYLASLPVDCLMYRPRRPCFRRNWVFSRVRATGRPDIRNKIICKGRYKTLPLNEHSRPVRRLLGTHGASVGAIVLNSLKDPPLFREAFNLALRTSRKDGKPLVILAMTDAMRRFTNWLLDQKAQAGDRFPELVFVVNETEAWEFARQLDPTVKPIMRGEHDTPNVRRFAMIAQAIRRAFGSAERCPRTYVTLGPHGSLGVDATSGHVCHVSSYPTAGVRIYDTNGCGDAYCAAVSLLEWASRNGYANIANVPEDLAEGKAHEMCYFMSVATAAAYCKATNRRGRVDASAVRDLLEHVYLGTAVLPTVTDICDGKGGPFVLDEDRLADPHEARFQTVTDDLERLMNGE